MWRNALLVIGQWDVGGGPSAVPYPGAWNGSLWSLSYEFGAYLCAATLFSLPIARRHPAITSVLALAVLTLGQIMAPLLGVTTTSYLHILWLGTFFSAGALLWAVASKIRLSPTAGALAAAVLGISIGFGAVKTLGAIPLAFLLLALGAWLPVRLGSKNDISYGVYIYAFPLQQVLAVTGIHTLAGFAGFAVLSLALTVPLAWLSWRFVEHPSIALTPIRFTARARTAPASRRNPGLVCPNRPAPTPSGARGSR